MSTTTRTKSVDEQLRRVLREVNADIDRRSVAALVRLGHTPTSAADYLLLPGSPARLSREWEEMGRTLRGLRDSIVGAFQALARGWESGGSQS